MNEQANDFKPYLKKALVLLMAVVMVFTYMPSMAWADIKTTDTTTCPVTITTAGGTTLTATATDETISDPYITGTAKVYEVAVPVADSTVVISGYAAGNFLTYNYDSEGNWLAGYYEDSGSTGVATSTVSVDANEDDVADYVYVQTPYVKAEGATWATSSFICAIKFVYQLPVEITIGEQKITTTDIYVEDGYSYEDNYSNDYSDLYIIYVESNTTEATVQKKDKTNFLAYNYGKNGYIAGEYNYTVGVDSATVKIDANGDGAADYIRIQNVYEKTGDSYSGGELLYTLQFVVEGGLPSDSESIPALSEYEQQAAAKEAMEALSQKTEYCNDSDWITAFYANGGTLSTRDKKTYLKKVYADIEDSTTSLGTLAKDVIGLVAMGYDPRNIENTDESTYNLLEKLYAAVIADLGAYGIYSAPYILWAYDSFSFELPEKATLTRDALIDYMVNAQGTDGSWGGYTYDNKTYPGTAGDTASVAQALLPYIKQDKVKAALDKAATFIGNNLDGSKTSTNYLAYITLYEAIAGEKASDLTVDSESGTDVMDYLLSNKLSDGTFKYGDAASTNKSASVDAFKALVAYKNLTDGLSSTSANIYNFTSRYYYSGLSNVTGRTSINDSLDDIFIKAPTKLEYKIGDAIDLSGLEVTALMVSGDKKSVSTEGITAEPEEISEGTQLSYSGFDTSTSGTKTVTVKYEEYDEFINASVGKTAEFIITVTASGNSSSDSVKSVSIGVYDDSGSTVVRANSYIIEADKTSVMDVLKAVLGNAGKTYVLKASGTYIAEIDGLGEFDRGQNSGWMYSVNGVTPPTTAANEYILNGGESIRWYYINDYTKNSSSSAWNTTTVTTDTTSGAAATTAPTETKVTEKTNADGTKEKTVAVTVSTNNQTEIIKQATDKKSTEIVLEVASTATAGAQNVQLQLNVSFVKNISEKTEAALTVNTENGTVSLDQATIKTVLDEAKGATITLDVNKVVSPTEVQKKAAGESGQILSLTVKSGDKTISDFKTGKVTVTVAISTALQNKRVAAIHIAEDGKIEQMPGKSREVGGKKCFEFTTSHFSDFALVDADELGLETEDEIDAAATAALVAKLTPVARSAKTAKGYIKVTTNLDKSDKAIISDLKDAGYTVKYRFYRSTKKSANYKSALTKQATTYTNTAGKKGTKYYYKVQVRAYDASGKLVAKTALKQCKYACRTK